MLTRLFQRAGAIGAASVALFVSLVLPAYAYDPGVPTVRVYSVKDVKNSNRHFEATYNFQRRYQQQSLDGVNPWKTDYVSKRIKVEKRGNPLKWVKRNPLEVAAAAAAASAGLVIDELTSQVTRPVESVPSDYEPGYFFGYYNDTYNGPMSLTLSGMVSIAIDSYFSDKPDWTYTSHTVTQLSADQYRLRANYKYPSGTQDYSNIYLAKRSCNSSVPICATSPEPVITFEPVSDTDVWSVFNPVANDAPAHHLEPWAKDANGNPYIYPEVQAQQAELAQEVGAAELPEAVVVNDPLAGQGLGPDGYPTGDPVPTPEAPPSEAPPLEFPTDYAREETLSEQKGFIQELRDYATELSTALKQDYNDKPDIDTDNPADEVYKPLTDQFDTLPDLPGGIPTVGDFGINSGSSCQQITFNWMGASVDFPSASQCSKLNAAKQILGWFIYVCTFFGCVYTILGARALKP